MKTLGNLGRLAASVIALVAAGGLMACGDDTGSGTGSLVEAGPDVTVEAGDAGTTDATTMGDSTTNTDATSSDVSADGEDVIVSDAPSPDPALPPDAGTVSCPTVINGALNATDGTQAGRLNRVGTAGDGAASGSTCGMQKGFPNTTADPANNPRYYVAYRFANPTAASVCFNFTLTYGTAVVVDSGSDASADAEAGADATASEGGADAGGDAADAGADAAIADAAVDAGTGDGAGGDAGGSDAEAGAVPAKYMAAFSTYYPAALMMGYLGDVGNQFTSPQLMGITVPAGGTIDVVVYAMDPTPAGVGTFTLSCSTQ